MLPCKEAHFEELLERSGGELHVTEVPTLGCLLSHTFSISSLKTFKKEFTTKYIKHSTLKFGEFKLLISDNETTEQLIYEESIRD